MHARPPASLEGMLKIKGSVHTHNSQRGILRWDPSVPQCPFAMSKLFLFALAKRMWPCIKEPNIQRMETKLSMACCCFKASDGFLQQSTIIFICYTPPILANTVHLNYMRRGMPTSSNANTRAPQIPSHRAWQLPPPRIVLALQKTRSFWAKLATSYKLIP